MMFSSRERGSNDKHRLHCPVCGTSFDMRDLLAVLEHQHRTGAVPEAARPNAIAAPVVLPFPRQPISNS